MTDHCAACGYPETCHELGTRKCPAATADKNGRRGKWRAPDPPEHLSWREIMRRDHLARVAAIEAARRVYEPPVRLPSQVPARSPLSAGEIAGYQGKQAVGLGRKAQAAGFAVRALYWRAGDATEGCGVWLSRGPLRALATWQRKPGSIGAASGWAADLAYAWRTDADGFPVRMTHTDLEGIIE